MMKKLFLVLLRRFCGSLSLHKESWNRNDDIGNFVFIPFLIQLKDFIPLS